MRKFIIERTIKDIGRMAPCELSGAAATSNAAIAKLFPAVQWVHSYVSGDKTFCIYLADSENDIKEHSRVSGIPFDRILEVDKMIDPLTANI